MLVSILHPTIAHRHLISHHVLWLSPGHHHAVHGLFLHRVAGERVGDRCGPHLAHLNLQLLALFLVLAPVELLLHNADDALVLGHRILAVVVGGEVCKLLVIGLSRDSLSPLVTFVDARSDWKEKED